MFDLKHRCYEYGQMIFLNVEDQQKVSKGWNWFLKDVILHLAFIRKVIFESRKPAETPVIK